MDDPPSRQSQSEIAFLRRLGLVLLIAAGAAVLYVTGIAWLVVFASLLVAIILHIIAEAFRKYLRFPEQLGLAGAVLILVAFMGGIGFMMYPPVKTEVGKAVEEFPEMVEKVRRSQFGAEILSNENQEMVMNGLSSLLTPLAVTVNWAFQLGSFVVLVVVLAVFFAHRPQLYREGVINAFPHRHRAEVRHLLDNYANALGLWLLGQMVAMVIVGCLTTALLLIFSMPYAFSLGLLAGFFQFVPYLGPLMWSVPAVAMGLGDSPSAAITMLAIYGAVQFFEGNVLTPVIQHRAVSLPPVLTLLATLLLGMMFGFLGIVLGTPLAVIAIVTYNQLYLRNTLGDTEVEVPGERSVPAGHGRRRLFSGAFPSRVPKLPPTGSAE